MERSKEFGSFFADASGGEGERCNYQSLLEPFVGHFELTVCEDVQSHYDYWRDNVNVNPDDCCNLRRTSE